MNTLFQQVIVATGISELFAAHAVARACERAGIDPHRLSPASLRIALPEIEKAVRTFCHDEVEQVMPRLHVLARH